MSRDEDTGELPAVGHAGDVLTPGEPVGRVNLPDEPDLPPDPSYLNSDQPSGLVAPMTPAPMREKVLFGVMAFVMMILAMVVILQGVFEQKMPI